MHAIMLSLLKILFFILAATILSFSLKGKTPNQPITLAQIKPINFRINSNTQIRVRVIARSQIKTPYSILLHGYQCQNQVNSTKQV